MDGHKFQFLRAVLGEDGAKALAKAAERGPELETALLPRTIMAWLGIAARSDFEGQIPGVENTYLQFSKSEESFSGSVAVGEQVYTFNKATLIHLGACVAVAIGSDHERVNPGLRDLDIQRLGKNIDALVKARVAVRELRRMKVEPLEKAISQIPAGPTTEAPPTKMRFLKDSKWYDYSHVLSPSQRSEGYSMRVSHLADQPGHPGNPEFSKEVPTGAIRGHLYHGGKEIGGMMAEHQGPNLYIDTADIASPEHQGKGLGQAMYEAVLAHGFHAGQVRNVTGGIHSTMAGRVHQRLADKHGLGYSAEQVEKPKKKFRGDSESYDGRNGPYEYTLKQEQDMAKAAKRPGGGAEAPGPAHAPTPPLQPLAPDAPQATQTSKGPTVGLRPKLPKIPQPKASTDVIQTGAGAKPLKSKSPTLKVTKSQADVECGVCGGKQFKGERFAGCICWRDLAKNVRVQTTDEGYTLEFGANWDQDAILTLIESFGRKH